MARLPRVVVAEVPHHITQRGNARQTILATDADRLAYLELLRHYAGLHELSLLGYCLMSNHVHLVAIPRAVESLAQTLKYAHGRYASYWNACHASSGHVWQGRFYSCPLDESHVWEALRYTELNPVRAGMVTAAEQWPWSSAGAHAGLAQAGVSQDPLLAMELWRTRWTVSEWCEYLAAGASPTVVASLRRATHTGRPLGAEGFVTALEKTTLRLLAPQKRGRHRRGTGPTLSPKLTFAA